MAEIETDIEPPLPDYDEDEGDPNVALHLFLREHDETRRSASTVLPPDASDADLADALVQVVLGCARMRSPGLLKAVERRIGESP